MEDLVRGFRPVHRSVLPKPGEAGEHAGLFDNGRLVCVLHLVPYTVDIRGAAVPSMYVAGASTLPEYRNRGLMAQLLHETLRALRERGLPITHLYPFLHAFYEKFSWATYTDMAYCRFRPEEAPGYAFSEELIPGEAELLYRAFTRDCTGYVRRTTEDYARRVGEYLIDGGRAACAYAGGVLKAYMLYEKDDAGLLAPEAVWSDEGALMALMAFAAEKRGAKTVQALLPAYAAVTGLERTVKPYGMARIADVPALLKTLPASGEGVFTLEIRDNFAEWNDGVYEIAWGGGNLHARRTADKPQASCGIAALAQLAHGYASWEALVRSGAAEEREKCAHQRISPLFPPKNTFIFEAY